MDKLRIGILGAARIAPMALIRPAALVSGVEIVAVAARDAKRARSFAAKHRIARAHGSYEELLADRDVDAIYNPLPNSLHCDWTVRALEAGKHVLCEKPLAANAAEAETMGRAATRARRVLMEAFHWRYHPLAARMKAVVDGGELGAVRRIETWMCIPMPLPGDIRYRLDLAGGATMDTGCYAISLLRFLAGAEPEVRSAEARLSSPGVDRWMTAEVALPGGRTGRVTCSLFSSTLLRVAARVEGDQGVMDVLNPIGPHIYHRMKVRTASGTRAERVPGDSTYVCQLRAFAAAVREGAAVPTGPDDSIANMRVIDAVYEKAGLGMRGRPS